MRVPAEQWARERHEAKLGARRARPAKTRAEREEVATRDTLRKRREAKERVTITWLHPPRRLVPGGTVMVVGVCSDADPHVAREWLAARGGPTAAGGGRRDEVLASAARHRPHHGSDTVGGLVTPSAAGRERASRREKSGK